ncbi:hypothetical protein [Achromobacter pulmonis]|uniref:hypothetical protein n=1 Tax=Achromobacter pulmonis TaxID=1389932 RepID=UPI001F472504|nr:hypothetical protein [Achromobacter pulmonis]MCF7767282.1 hypothetical protein [Achromobacter pulmonis]
MEVTTTEWTGAVGVAACSVAVQFLIAYLSRRQIAKQLDLQHLVSHRTTATFVADKRQKWIDELRTDMAFYLALSQEIVWKWDGMRSRAALRVQEDAKNDAGEIDPVMASKIFQDVADAFSPENGARDREHQERHIRLMFRLNPKKDLHVKLRECLDLIRKSLHRTQGARTRAEAKELLDRTIHLIREAQDQTEAILKAEWQRVKQEVAYPEVLMSTIPKPVAKK